MSMVQYAGMDRFDVRKQTEKDPWSSWFCSKTEPIPTKWVSSERTDVVVIEPKLSMQWFLKMEKLANRQLWMR